MLQTAPFRELTETLGPGLQKLDRPERWFIVAALADRLLNNFPFAEIVDHLDPEAKISYETCRTLYSLEGHTMTQIWKLQHEIVKQLIAEEYETPDQQKSGQEAAR